MQFIARDSIQMQADDLNLLNHLYTYLLGSTMKQVSIIFLERKMTQVLTIFVESTMTQDSIIFLEGAMKQVSTRYVDGTPMSEVTPATIQSIHPPHHLTLKLQGQGQGQDHIVSLVSNWFAFFLCHINQITIPEIQLFWNLTLKIKGQGHGWAQRSRSHGSPSIQPMYLLFISHQSDQPFLRYVHSVWPWKNTSEIFKENSAKKGYSHQFS